MASILMPAAGFRWNFHPSLAFDFGVFSTLSNILGSNTTDIPLKSTQSADSACASNATHFVSNLPCVGNATLRPYGAAFFGFTVFQGSSVSAATVSAATIAGTLGAARTTNDSTAHFYGGVMIVFVPVLYTVPVEHEVHPFWWLYNKLWPKTKATK